MGEGIMEKFNERDLCLVRLDENECISLRGGDGTWDKEIVRGIGFGIGYGAKKFVRMLSFLSKNLYEAQSRTMVIYK